MSYITLCRHLNPPAKDFVLSSGVQEVKVLILDIKTSRPLEKCLPKENRTPKPPISEQVFDYLKSTHQQMLLRGKERLSRDKRPSRKSFYTEL